MMGLSNTLLPQTPWLQSAGLQRVVSALSDGDNRPRLVGGAVRDCILGLPVADVDLATPIAPNDVVRRLEEAGIKAVPTGIAHGTITAVANNQSFEITTLRRDVSTDGRRATVAFSDNWHDDAARRDFTINALYADPETREIFDYFGGIQDLNDRRLRFIGNAADRIAEDHLRILRFFRFLARFGGDMVDADALAACRDAANSLMALSRERIASELMKIITVKNPVHAVSLMIDVGIFAPFLPELRPDALPLLSALIAREQLTGTTATAAARLLCLLPHDAAAADKVAMRLKLSNRMRNEIAARLNAGKVANPANIRTLAYFNDIDMARDLALMFAPHDDLAACMALLSGWTLPDFNFKGGQLIGRGISAGPLVARTLQAIERHWVAAGFPDGDAFAALIDQQVELALLSAKKV
jgi:poly(A) polymerase